VTIWAFVRIGTKSRIWPNPRSAKEAFAIVGEWLAQPGVIPLNPGPLHAAILGRLVRDYGAIGPLVTDAVLARSRWNTARRWRLRTWISDVFPTSGG